MPKPTFFNLANDKQERIMDAIIKEMGEHTFEHININNIIKDANIPRGSFYQYFEDKKDMYDYFYTYIAKKKFEYWGNLLNFDEDIPFLDRFYMIYLKGYEFTRDYPDLVQVGKKMLSSDFMTQSDQAKMSMKIAIDHYAKYIKIDQEKGRIRKDIDPVFLSTMLLEMMNKLSIDDLMKDQFSMENIEKNVKMMIDILKKGIQTHV